LTRVNGFICKTAANAGTGIIPAILLMIMFLLTFAQPASASGDQTQIRRYLLAAGANNGGKERVMLRYAVTDARAFANLLIDMGGVEKNNAQVLAEPGSREFLGGIANLNKLIAGDKTAAPDVKNEVFVYYSGHAGIDGLKLGSETLSWADLRGAINGINAEVRVAVLDACGSGAITRTKGGTARPAFLADASTNITGYAFLTSSNELEASQESDRIKGSYFTHALLNGLRGAADMTGDGRVTINEAYQYAFNETMQSTQNTSAGTQHPSRDMNLAGTGDIVMTDLRVTSAILSLSPDIEGRFFIRDAGGNLFAELRKVRGRGIDLGISPGKYSVQMEAPSRRWMASDILISDGKKTTLTMNDMTAMAREEKSVRRGNVFDGFEEEDVEDAADSLAGGDNTVDELQDVMRRGRAAVSADTSAPSPPSSPVSPTIPGFTPDTSCYSSYGLNVNILGLSFAVGTGREVDYTPFAQGCAMIQSGVVNLAADIEYVQAGAVNIANRVGYIQAGAFNIANRVGYMQSGVLSIAKRVGYMQGGSVNFADSVGYIQAGSLNIATSAGYLQAGSFNIAKSVGYLQAGVLNLADSVGRVQAGAVNIANKTGRQIGVVNISKYSEKTPIGLINIVGNGIFEATLYAESGSNAGLSLRTGTPWLYTIFDYGQPAGEPIEECSKWWGWGFGSRFGMSGPLFLNFDLLWSQVYYGTGHRDYISIDEANTILPGEDRYWYNDWYTEDLFRARLGISYSPVPFLAITAGVSANALFEGGQQNNGSWYDWSKNPIGKNSYTSEWMAGSRHLRVWPGAYAGVTVGMVRAAEGK